MTTAISLSNRCKFAAFLTTAILTVLLPSLASGQGSTPSRSFQPGGSYALSDIESINTSNGNLMLNLALGKLAPGRGGLSGQLNLRYDSKLFDSHQQYYQDWEHLLFGEPQTITRNMLMTSDQGGWHYGTSYQLQLIDRMYEYPPELAPQYPAQETIYHYKVKVAFPDGSLKEFFPRVGSLVDQGYSDIRPDGYQSRFNGSYVSDVPYLTNNVTYYTFDGTYIRLDVQHDSDGNWSNNPWTLYFPDGTTVTNFGTRITDRNGNFIEWSNVTYNGHPATQLMDQLGRKVILEHQGVSDGDVIHVPGVSGVDLTYQVHWKGIQIYKTYSTAEIQHGQDPNGYPDMLGSQYVVSSIDLPAATGGLQYLFGYNAVDSGSTPCCTSSFGWGELSSVTLPSGAQAQYQYQLDGQNGPGFGYKWTDVLKNSVTRKSLTYQQQYDGSSTPVTETWNYDISPGAATITSPDGGVVTQLGQPTYRTQTADGSINEKIWQGNRPQNFFSTSVYDPVTGIDSYDPERANSYVKTDFTSIRDINGTLTKTAIKDYSYDKNGNVTSIREYDWVDYGSVPRNASGFPTGIPAGAVLKRVTTNNYVAATPDASDISSNDSDSYWNSTSPALKNIVASSEISNGASTLTRKEFFYDNPATTGNLTQQKQWDSTRGAYSDPLTGSNSISTSSVYNQYGSPTLTTDARGVQTQIVYGSVGGFSDLYPTQVKTAYQTAVQRTETREYDFTTGVVTRVTDVDNNVATATTYDVFGRPTLVKAAEGKSQETRTSTEYSDVNRRLIVRSDLNTLGDGKLVSIQHYDQLGRIRLARQLEDAAQSAYDETTGIKVQTRYIISNPCQPASTSSCLADNSSLLGSYQLASNPYRANTSSAAGSETTMGWTRLRSDKAGRTIAVEAFGGTSLPLPWGANSSSTGVVVTSYDANATTVMDQAGKVRRSLTDGLARLSRVDEPDSNGALGSVSSPNQTISYTYNALDNLTTVSQGAQTRTFVYDSLKRLSSATNPESGTLTYSYDNNGNLTSKVDARSITTTFVYDSLNRVTSRSYSDGTPSVTYTYDAASVANSKGRLTSVNSSVSVSNLLAYDVLGRVTSANQVTDGQTYSMSYGYNLASAQTSFTYPSGRVISTEYDTAGRMAGVRDQQSGAYYAGAASSDSTNRIKYAAHGGVSTVKLGNNLWEHTEFNSRLQSTEIGLGTSGTDSSTMRLTYNFGTTNNNGNVQSIGYLGGGLSYTQSFSYDELNRLTTSSESGSSWSQTNKYDRYGNRSIDLGGGNQSLYFNTSNRITNTGYSYDVGGNLTNDGTQAFGYDAENKIKSVNGVSDIYRYDGDGNRIRKNFTNGEKVRMVYSGGQLVAEYDLTTGSLTKEYVYGAKGLVATIEPSNGTRYTTSDHLGSPRAVTNSTAGVVSRHDYMPFGEELGSGVGSRTTGMGFTVNDGVRQKFTSKERDIETGLDYFGARYYASAQGRFTSPDEFKGGPEELFGDVDPHDPLLYADVAEPQSLNKYQYALNNPLRYIDPDGHQTITADQLKRAAAEATKPPVQVAQCAVNIQVGLWKAAGNALIGAHNIGAIAMHGKTIAPLQENGADCQYMSMHAGEVLLLAVPAAEKMGPANVLVGESAEATKATGAAVTFDEARVAAFKNAGMTNPSEVKFTKVDPKTGTIVEFKGGSGAKVAYDGPHAGPGQGHDSPHVGWQAGGKRGEMMGGRIRGNIPYSGPQHPSRSPIKGEGVVEPH